MPTIRRQTIAQNSKLMDNDIFARSAELLELDGIILLNMNIDNKFAGR